MWITKQTARSPLDCLRDLLAAERGATIYLSEEHARAAAASLSTSFGPWEAVHLAELVQAARIEMERLHQRLQSMLSFLHSPTLKVCRACGDQLAKEAAAEATEAAADAAALPSRSQVN